MEYNKDYIAQVRSRGKVPAKFLRTIKEKYGSVQKKYPVNEEPIHLVSDELIKYLLADKSKEELIELIAKLSAPAAPTSDFVNKKKRAS